VKFLADENFNGKILRGLKREYPEIEIIRAQDTEMYQSSDPDLLRWATEKGYLILTHDAKTMPHHAHEQLANGLNVTGVIIVKDSISFRIVIDDLLAISQASSFDEWQNKVTFLPL
jgi:hypothetical protein